MRKTMGASFAHLGKNPRKNVQRGRTTCSDPLLNHNRPINTGGFLAIRGILLPKCELGQAAVAVIGYHDANPPAGVHAGTRQYFPPEYPPRGSAASSEIPFDWLS
jgi:hypothetical protein